MINDFTTLLTTIALVWSVVTGIVFLIYLFVSTIEKRKAKERDLIEAAKGLIKRYNITLDEDNCEVCGETCLLLTAYKEVKKEAQND